jgi:head-tail adaptor
MQSSVIAHISGFPVEELVLPVVYCAGTVWAAVRVVTSRSRRSTPREMRMVKLEVRDRVNVTQGASRRNEEHVRSNR